MNFLVSARRLGSTRRDVPELTFAQRLAATDGGVGPLRHWRMADAVGPTMAAAIGGLNGSYVNIADIEFQLDPLVSNSSSGRCVAFGGAASPGHATIATPLQSAAFTAFCMLQLDTHKSKHVILTTGGGTVPGEFVLEIVDDGQNGLKPRCWSVDDGGTPVIHIGVDPATVPVGRACALAYVRDGDGSQRVYINGSEITLTVENGTPPAGWSAHPQTTWYVGQWSSGADPLDGLIAELALWPVALPAADLVSISTPLDVLWLRDADLGAVDADATAVVDLAQHAHPTTGFTPVVIAQGARGTAITTGEDVAYLAGSEVGDDDIFQARISRNGVTSRIATFTIDVVGVAAGNENANQPYFGLYYGGPPLAHNPANLEMDADSVFAFFYADPPGGSGQIDRIRYQRRTGDVYSSGDGGTYTISIVAADPATRKPIEPFQVKSQVTGYQPGNPGDAQAFLEVAVTPSATVNAKDPLCMVWERTAGGHVSMNVTQFFRYDSGSFVDPGDTQHPAEFWYPARVVVGGEEKAFYPVPVTGRLNSGFYWRGLGVPLFGYRWSDGTWGGWGPWGRDHDSALYNYDLSTTTHGRMRFRVSRGDRVVDRVLIPLWRFNAGGGEVTVSVESGPATFNSGNGTLIEEVTLPASSIPDVGPSFHFDSLNAPGNADKVGFTEFVFSQPRTLADGEIYSLRVRASTSGVFQLPLVADEENQDLSPATSDFDDWDAFQAARQYAWTTFDDSMGAQQSSNGGSSWSNPTRRFPVLFKCVL